MANELVPVKEFNIIPFDGDLATTIKEELDGLGEISFDIVKIPSGGGRAFEVPGDDPENPDTVTELIGIIVAHYPYNIYWAAEFTGDNTPPDCFSADGKIGIVTETGEQRACADCPLNEYGSGDKGIGKACQNKHKIFLLREGDVLPLELALPATSLKPFKEYVAKKVLLTKQPKKLWQVITKVTLKSAVSKTGIKYSQAAFARIGTLENDTEIESSIKALDAIIQAARKSSKEVERAMRFEEITDDGQLDDLPLI